MLLTSVTRVPCLTVSIVFARSICVVLLLQMPTHAISPIHIAVLTGTAYTVSSAVASLPPGQSVAVNLELKAAALTLTQGDSCYIFTCCDRLSVD